MNTPEPCCSCGFLYVDCMSEADPNYTAECIKGLPLGNVTCKKYKYYREVSLDEKWKED
jgi:hypothetical protein